MVKVLVLGSTGMLGNAVASHFLNSNDFETYITHRGDLKLDEKSIFFDAYQPSFDSLPNVDYIINCIGVIKPFMSKSMVKSIYLNSMFPRELADYCKKKQTKLIHISTDCVYSGAKGSYTEEDAHDCLEAYGKTKSLGEPENCMVLRTSIIGKEIHKDASFIAWAISQRGKTVNGYTNHFWNGMTTRQYAKCCEIIIKNNLYINGLRHIHSPTTVTKRDMLTIVSDVFELDLEVIGHETPQSCDRSMMSGFELSSKLDIPEIEYQIKDLKQ